MSDVDIFYADLDSASYVLDTATMELLTEAANLVGEDTGVGNPAQRASLRLELHRRLAALHDDSVGRSSAGSELSAALQAIRDRYPPTSTTSSGVAAMTLMSPRQGYPLERIEGDTASMSWWNGMALRVGDKLDALRAAAQTATELPGTGRSITAAREDAHRLVRTLAPVIAEAELLAGVLQRYADAYDAHAERANAMIEDIEAAHAEWVRLNEEADLAGRRAMAASWGDDQARMDELNDAAADAIALRDAARDDLDELWSEYEACYGESPPARARR